MIAEKLSKFVFLSFVLFSSVAYSADPGSCGAADSKIVYDSKSQLGERVVFSGVKLCLAGHAYRIFAAESSFVLGYYWDYSSGLCRAAGFAKRVSFDGERITHPEKLASFDMDGNLQGVFLTEPSRDPNQQSIYLAETLVCTKE